MQSAVSRILLVTILGLAVASPVLGEPNPGGAFPWEGEVSATNVFVRSGAGSNWYPTTKLNPGDRVLVLGEKFGWYQISPPLGSFSYVDMSVVDRKPGAKTGTIKQDKVYIRAGSLLESRKSSTQVVLNKGATVEIQGEAEGFFKIAPPSGASLYISKQYVKPIAANLSTGLVERHVAENPPTETAATSDPPAASDAVNEPRVAINDSAMPVDSDQAQPVPLPVAQESSTVDPTNPTDENVADGPVPEEEETVAPPTADKTTPITPTPAEVRKPDATPAAKVAPSADRYRAMLEVLESELRSASQKPFDQQNFADLRRRYEEIAVQTQDRVAAEIAKIRARQIKDRASLRDSRKDLRTDEIELANYRANMDAERMKIMRRRAEATLVKFDLEGELRKSAVFQDSQRRFRLVDRDRNETIAYVDIPKSVEPDVEHLVGRLVGIRTAGQTFSPSARLPIVVAASVTDLSPRLHLGNEQPLEAPEESDEPVDESAATEEHQPDTENTAHAADGGDAEPEY